MSAPGAPAEPVRPVVMVVPLPPSYRGGTEEYAYRLALRVHAEMPVQIVTTSVRWGHDAHPLPTGDVPIEVLPAREVFQRPVVSAQGMRTLRRWVERAGLVQVHMPFPWVERQVARWAARAGVPVVLTYHMDADFASATGLRAAGAITRLYRAMSARPALRRAAAVVSNSRGYAEASPVLSGYLPKTRVIHKGVDVDRLGLADAGPVAPVRPPPDPTLFPGAGAQTGRVAFVGRLVPYKGLLVLLEALARVVGEGVDAKLYLAGRGPMRPALEARVRELSLGDRVVFLGFVPDERLHDLYVGADVVACPSISLLESTATCLEEAAACGVPVLGSALPGTEETVPHDGVHGVLATPRDPASVAAGLARLLRQPRPIDRPAFRTWEDTSREYLGLFRELLGTGRAP